MQAILYHVKAWNSRQPLITLNLKSSAPGFDGFLTTRLISSSSPAFAATPSEFIRDAK